MKVTLKDIAEETGFSISTVSRVLNGSDKISPKTRRIIVHTAKKLNYPIYFNQNGDHLQEILKVCLVVSDLHVGEFYASLFHGIQKAAEEQNVRLTITNIDTDFPEITNRLKEIAIEQQLDGLIFFTPEFNKQDYLQLKNELPEKLPLISNGLIENPVLTTVTFDSYSGGYLAAEHFSKKGYKQCGIIQGPFQKAEARYRANGFRDYILQYDQMEVTWEYSGDFSFNSGAEAFADFRSSATRPRAIFACNDSMCHGFMEEALMAGFCFPDDIAIIGFDDLPICKRHRPTISSVHTNYQKLGSVTMESLREILTNPEQQKGVLSLVPVNLVARESS